MTRKKVLVASAWPYASNVPHLGNLIGSLLSGDVFSRYYKLFGYDCTYVSGTDAHGTRIEYEAKKKGVSPKELVEKTHKKIVEVLKGFEIEFDNYTTTESEVHKKFVRNIYLKMEKNGYIFSKVEKRMYCNKCKKFLADRFVTGTCPKCGYEHAKGNQCDKCGALLEPEELINPKCEICGGKDLVLKETKHWYLDLEKLKPDLERYVKSHPEWKGNVKNFTIQLLKNLKPRAVTRDLEWGIDAPFEGAEGKKIYVWAEAALGYVSACIEKDRDWRRFWFGDDIKQIYCIGKDNIPFHTIIFPGQLIASGEGYHLPDQISATEYLNWIGGSKFSKSMNVGLYCDEALKLLPATYWRFYLLYNRPENKDVNFSWEELDKAVNQILIGSYVNLVNRVLTLINKYYDGKLESCELSKEGEEILDKTLSTKEEYRKIIESGFLTNALKKVMDLAYLGNAFFQKREPWKNEDKRLETLFVCANLVKDIAIMLYPFTPSLSMKILDLFNVPYTQKELGKSIGEWNGYICKKPKPILQKIDVNKLKREYEESHKREGENLVEYDDFKKLDLRVGEIKKVEDVEGADKLYKITISIGDGERTIVAGLKPYYKKEELEGRRVVYLSNLKPKKIRGIESKGMILAAEDENGKVALLEPDKDVEVGAKIY